MRTQGAGNLWRIMTSNVWADVFGNPVEGRDTQLAQVYEHYLPDVLCLQEMHPNWHASRLKPQLAQRYDEVVAEQGDYALNYTPVFYRRDRLRLIGSAFHVFSGPNDFDSKSFTAAVFEPLDGGEAFAVLSTHLYYEDNDFGNRVRVQNVPGDYRFSPHARPAAGHGVRGLQLPGGQRPRAAAGGAGDAQCAADCRNRFAGILLAWGSGL